MLSLQVKYMYPKLLTILKFQFVLQVHIEIKCKKWFFSSLQNDSVSSVAFILEPLQVLDIQFFSDKTNQYPSGAVCGFRKAVLIPKPTPLLEKKIKKIYLSYQRYTWIELQLYSHTLNLLSTAILESLLINFPT